MKIKTDQEGMTAIKTMCDICLKVGGLRNLKEINKIIENTELLKEKPCQTKEKRS